MFTKMLKWLFFSGAILFFLPAAPMLGPIRWVGGCTAIAVAIVLARLEGYEAPKP